MNWDSRSLEIVSSTLGVLRSEEWPAAAREMRASNATILYLWSFDPDFPRSTTGGFPIYDPDSDTVMIRNPFPGVRVEVNGRSVYSRYIQVDAGMAEKVLLLSSPPVGA